MEWGLKENGMRIEREWTGDCKRIEWGLIEIGMGLKENGMGTERDGMRVWNGD